MESRLLNRRRGFALMLVLIIMLFLEGLMAVAVWWTTTLKDETEDIVLQGRVETVARDVLEQVTDWVSQNKPEGPDGTYDVVALSSGASLSQLELSLPSSLCESSEDDIDVAAQLHWCMFTPPSSISSSTAEEFPPALADMVENDGVFRQSFIQSSSGSSQGRDRSYAAWRIKVCAWSSDEDDDDFYRVVLERVVVFEL